MFDTLMHGSCTCSYYPFAPGLRKPKFTNMVEHQSELACLLNYINFPTLTSVRRDPLSPLVPQPNFGLRL